MNSTTGTLYLVSTPIGNLGDLSGRARDTLREVDLILAEDTRRFRILATHFGIDTPVRSYHEHNERTVSDPLVQQLLEGKSIALVSDAGTPTISDPGYHLINVCHKHNVPVRSVPGPCAAIAALSISGFDTNSFTYCGFVPIKSGRRERILREAVERPHPSIFYESPHRIVKSVEALVALDPAHELFVVRELTKLYEEYFRGDATGALTWLTAKPSIKGEFVFLTRGTRD